MRRPNREHKCTITQDGSAASAEAQTCSKREANNSEMREGGSGQDLASLYQYNTNADRMAACKTCSIIWKATVSRGDLTTMARRRSVRVEEGPREGRGRHTPSKEERKKQAVGRWDTGSDTDTAYLPEVEKSTLVERTRHKYTCGCANPPGPLIKQHRIAQTHMHLSATKSFQASFNTAGSPSRYARGSWATRRQWPRFGTDSSMMLEPARFAQDAIAVIQRMTHIANRFGQLGQEISVSLFAACEPQIRPDPCDIAARI